MATGVTVSYNGNVIHQMPANGQFTMNTEGAYMEGDVEVVVDVPTSGGSDLIHKTINENGIYDPALDDADGYDEVTVNVPNSYSASDEGKVVSNGALVAQSSQNITENGTYDTTLKNEVVVNIESGGGSGVLVEPDFFGLAYAYVATNGSFFRDAQKAYCLNIFTVEADKTYEIFLGKNPSNRFRAHFYANKSLSDFEPYLETAGSNTEIYACTYNITGTSEITNMDLRFLYTPSSNGVIIVGTTNVSVETPAYCVNMDDSILSAEGVNF